MHNRILGHYSYRLKNISVKVKIELSVEQIVNIQDAIKSIDYEDALQIVGNISAPAVLDFVKQLPYEIKAKSDDGSDEVDPAPKEIQVYVKGLSGNPGAYNMRTDRSTHDLALVIQHSQGVKEDRQILWFAGKMLGEGQTLGQASIAKIQTGKDSNADERYRQVFRTEVLLT